MNAYSIKMCGNLQITGFEHTRLLNGLAPSATLHWRVFPDTCPSRSTSPHPSFISLYDPPPLPPHCWPATYTLLSFRVHTSHTNK